MEIERGRDFPSSSFFIKKNVNKAYTYNSKSIAIRFPELQ